MIVLFDQNGKKILEIDSKSFLYIKNCVVEWACFDNWKHQLLKYHKLYLSKMKNLNEKPQIMYEKYHKLCPMFMILLKVLFISIFLYYCRKTYYRCNCFEVGTKTKEKQVHHLWEWLIEHRAGPLSFRMTLATEALLTLVTEALFKVTENQRFHSEWLLQRKHFWLFVDRAAGLLFLQISKFQVTRKQAFLVAAGLRRDVAVATAWPTLALTELPACFSFRFLNSKSLGNKRS